MENIIEKESKEQYVRFKDAEWFGHNKEILIIGQGGTGSWLSLLLARTGDHTFYIYDDDIYEKHNMAGQFVQASQINKSKVEASKNNIMSFCDNNDVICFHERYVNDSPTNSIVFCCPDNMEVRRVAFYNWLESIEDGGKDYLFVDLRLLAESLTIFIVQGNKLDQIEEYKNNLPLDSEVEDAECTLKQTSHAAALIAALTTGFFTNWISNLHFGMEYRQIPFRYDYLIPANYGTSKYLS